MSDKTDFLERHKDNLQLFGFWNEMYKSTVIAAIEVKFKAEITAEYQITDIVMNGEKVLVKWSKRMPL